MFCKSSFAFKLESCRCYLLSFSKSSGDNRRWNGFTGSRFLCEWRFGGSENFFNLLLLESSQCHVWYVSPVGQNCYFTSSPMLTQKTFTVWCAVGLSPLHGEKKHHILPSMSHNDNSRLSKKVCIFFRDQASRLYSQGVFTFHNTELLPYRLIQAKGCYLFLIAASSLFVRLGNRWNWNISRGEDRDAVASSNDHKLMILASVQLLVCIQTREMPIPQNEEQESTGSIKKRKIRMSGLSERRLSRSARHRLPNVINGDWRLFFASAVYNRPPASLTGLAQHFTCHIHTAQGPELGYIIMPSLPSPFL